MTAVCKVLPKGLWEDSGILIFKDLQPTIPNWGAGQNHLGRFSKGPTPELNQVGTRSVWYGQISMDR